MAASGAKLIGRAFVSRQLKQLLPREMIAVMRRSTLAFAKAIGKGMRQRAPRRSGTLRKAIVWTRSRGRKGVAEAKVMITTGAQSKYDAWYWHLVEYDTPKTTGKSFVRSTVDEFRPKYVPMMRREIRTQVLVQMEKRAQKQKVKVR